MSTLLFYVLAFVAGLVTAFCFSKLFKGSKFEYEMGPRKHEPLFDKSDFWDPAAAGPIEPTKKRKSKGKRKGK